ncbi:MAG: hypothetical protein V2A64_00375 [Candidatus Omnitrophota bacterium]
MSLPKNNRRLGEIFKDAGLPEVSEFNGEYFVDMLTVLPSLKAFSHRKFFYSQNGKVIGYNILFTRKVWGHFFVEQGVCEAADSLPAVVINYNRTENSFISNRIRDYVRCIEKDKLYLGRFNYILRGKLYFLGYFSLSRPAATFI